MKRNLLLVVMLTLVSLFTTTSSRAGFVVKQPASKVIVTNTTATETPAATTGTAATTTGEVKTHQSFFHKLLSKIGILGKKASMPMWAYIVLSIFWLGWLAIGINEDWGGAHWIIALILYILFWLPGFIYSLVLMGRYY